MRKIVCGACRYRPEGHGVWMVFDSAVICESCRLAAINWMLASGFGFDHVFIAELSTVDGSWTRNRK